jgi:hypothetical protein
MFLRQNLQASQTPITFWIHDILRLRKAGVDSKKPASKKTRHVRLSGVQLLETYDSAVHKQAPQAL